MLLVEDTADLREMWRLTLDAAGFDVVEACNGAEAVTLAYTSHPDLVVMDLWMPVMDGVEAIRRLKSDPTTAAVPIVALTAESGAAIALRAKAAGCDDFRAKPITPDDLLHVIRRLVAVTGTAST